MRAYMHACVYTYSVVCELVGGSLCGSIEYMNKSIEDGGGDETFVQ